MNSTLSVRLADPKDFEIIGKLMVEVYAKIEGFPTQEEQPKYYETLANVGEMTQDPGTEVLVAVYNKEIVGGVVYIGDMKYYRAKSSARQEENAVGIRFLAVRGDMGGKGIGRALTVACIQRAKEEGRSKVILHTTEHMQVAWKMYEKMGFARRAEFDFMPGEMKVFGFQLFLDF